LVYIFFFQAEDGIRCLTVTGVQTCALPILRFAPAASGSQTGTLTVANNDPLAPSLTVSLTGTGVITAPSIAVSPVTLDFGSVNRSEERRVGKECGYRC